MNAAERGLMQLVPDIQKIYRSGRYLLSVISVINDLLDLSKIEAGKTDPAVEPFDLCGVPESVIETAQPLVEHRRNRLELICSGPGGNAVGSDEVSSELGAGSEFAMELPLVARIS